MMIKIIVTPSIVAAIIGFATGVLIFASAILGLISALVALK